MPIRIKLALLGSLACGAGVLTGPANPPDASALAEGLTAAAADLPPGIPGDWWTKVQQDIRQSEYHITWQGQTATPEPSARSGHALSPSGLIPLAAFRAESNQAVALYGSAATTAGDVNGDGYDDVIVGAPYYDKGQTDEGRVWVYHGSASGLISLAAFRAESDQTGAQYGWAAATAGDVNGDGYDDVIVGAPLYDNGETNEGRADVYHGPL